MPEGPEISYMSKFLNKYFLNSKLKNIIIYDGTYKKYMPSPFKKFLKNLPSKITDINNKGKFIYFRFNNNLNLCMTLSLTGHFLLNRDNHVIYEFVTSNGSFYLQDMRRFARFYFMTDEELNNKLNKLGPDILHNNVSFKLFKEKLLKKKKSKIASALIDQKVISGIGNYIRCDSLYYAKINPFRLVSDLNDEEILSIYNSVKYIIKKSFKSIMSNKDYDFLVYRKKETKKGEKVVRQKLEKSRNIYWCPIVQK